MAKELEFKDLFRVEGNNIIEKSTDEVVFSFNMYPALGEFGIFGHYIYLENESIRSEDNGDGSYCLIANSVLPNEEYAHTSVTHADACHILAQYISGLKLSKSAKFLEKKLSKGDTIPENYLRLPDELESFLLKQPTKDIVSLLDMVSDYTILPTPLIYPHFVYNPDEEFSNIYIYKESD